MGICLALETSGSDCAGTELRHVQNAVLGKQKKIARRMLDLSGVVKTTRIVWCWSDSWRGD
jgi:hypothetical protein